MNHTKLEYLCTITGDDISFDMSRRLFVIYDGCSSDHYSYDDIVAEMDMNEKATLDQAIRDCGTNISLLIPGFSDPLQTPPKGASVLTQEEMDEILGLVDDEPDTSSDNNGGATDYYRIDPSWVMAQDIIEVRDMNYSQGNIFKVAFTFNIGRHDASNYERELNKIIYFAQRELDQLTKDN